ncbi:hypothetical protein AAHC03_05360 [Spirometra sp. Aus1]
MRLRDCGVCGLLLLACQSLASIENIPGIAAYDVLNYPSLSGPANHLRKKRSTSDQSRTEFEEPIHLNFSAFGRPFSLILYRDTSLYSPNLDVIVGGTKFSSDLSKAVTQHAVRGFLKNHPKSLVFGTLVNGLFRGTIATRASLLVEPTQPSDSASEDDDQVFYVEPSGNFFGEAPEFHSIIYKATDAEDGPALSRGRRSSEMSSEPWFCGLSDPNISKLLRDSSQPVEVPRSPRSAEFQTPYYYHKKPVTPPEAAVPVNRLPYSLAAHLQRLYQTKSSSGCRHCTVDEGPTSRVCSLYLQSDTFLWNHVIGLPHIHGNKDLAVKEIASIFTQHVQGAQAIYQFANFTDPSGHSYRGVSFRVDRVLINVTERDCRPVPIPYRRPVERNVGANLPPTPSALPRTIQLRPEGRDLPPLERGSYAIHNPFCSENVDVTNFLNLNSYVNHDDFCLAYVFTYRDFSGGTLGLAWVAEPGGSGGICEKHRLMREGTQTVRKSLNTGVVTLLNYGTRVSMKISQLTFAHEMGHNLGAKHDDDFKEDFPSCLPSVDDPKGNYIMFASATGGDKENNNKFSNCSLNSIARLLTHVLKSESNCFLTSNGSFCGNRLTEDGEQCDCGYTRDDCDDVCCHPKESTTPCNLTRSITVDNTTLKVHCSPTAGECCTSTCQYRNSTHLCRAAGECHKSSYCLGNAVRCPPPESLADGTPCKNFTRICKSGECLGSICERIPGWQECSLTHGKNVTPEMMCYVACRENRTGAPCISTIQLETDEDLRKAYPSLAAELLHQNRGVRLQPGSPCDNYRGYCDVFLRCQSVVAEGPLARLRNLLFSPQVLDKVKTWITVHWWAMLLISFGAIMSMIIFMKLCSYRTPSSQGARPLPYSRGPSSVRMELQSRSQTGHPRHQRQRGPGRSGGRGKRHPSGNRRANQPCLDEPDPPHSRNAADASEITLQQLHLREPGSTQAGCSAASAADHHGRHVVPSFVLKRPRLLATAVPNATPEAPSPMTVNMITERIPPSSVAIPYQRRRKHLNQRSGNGSKWAGSSAVQPLAVALMDASHTATALVAAAAAAPVPTSLVATATPNGLLPLHGDRSQQQPKPSQPAVARCQRPTLPTGSVSPRGTPPPLYSMTSSAKRS